MGRGRGARGGERRAAGGGACSARHAVRASSGRRRCAARRLLGSPLPVLAADLAASRSNLRPSPAWLLLQGPGRPGRSDGWRKGRPAPLALLPPIPRVTDNKPHDSQAWGGLQSCCSPRARRQAPRCPGLCTRTFVVDNDRVSGPLGPCERARQDGRRWLWAKLLACFDFRCASCLDSHVGTVATGRMPLRLILKFTPSAERPPLRQSTSLTQLPALPAPLRLASSPCCCLWAPGLALCPPWAVVPAGLLPLRRAARRASCSRRAAAQPGLSRGARRQRSQPRARPGCACCAALGQRRGRGRMMPRRLHRARARRPAHCCSMPAAALQHSCSRPSARRRSCPPPLLRPPRRRRACWRCRHASRAPRARCFSARCAGGSPTGAIGAAV